MREHGIVILNIAGPRASEEPEVGQFVKTVFAHAFKSAL
jgi:hypothetical protein